MTGILLHPDFVVMTGDFLTHIASNTLGDVTQSLAAFNARNSVLAILGNHDHWTDAAAISRAVRQVPGVQLLLNEHKLIQRGNDRLYFAGVDDIWEQQNDLPRTLEGNPSGAAVVLLAHEPDYANQVSADNRVGLQLSGHSHGGQIRIPFVGPLKTPPLGQKYDMGLYKIAGLTLYTNRGLGMVGNNMRLNCRPEITHITLL